MRLSTTEIKAIKEVCRQVFGEHSTVSLFGSRTDDNLRGGDIDIFIRCNRRVPKAELYNLKIIFLIELKKRIGDQKIDVIIAELHNDHMWQSIKHSCIVL